MQEAVPSTSSMTARTQNVARLVKPPRASPRQHATTAGALHPNPGPGLANQRRVMLRPHPAAPQEPASGSYVSDGTDPPCLVSFGSGTVAPVCACGKNEGWPPRPVANSRSCDFETVTGSSSTASGPPASYPRWLPGTTTSTLRQQLHNSFKAGY